MSVQLLGWGLEDLQYSGTRGFLYLHTGSEQRLETVMAWEWVCCNDIHLMYFPPQSAMKQHEEVLIQLKAEIEAMEGEEGEVQARLMDLRHELERYSAKMKENQQKIKHFQNEVGEGRGERGGRCGENRREGYMWRAGVSMFGREGTYVVGHTNILLYRHT